jgi:hypothetical protein
MLALQREHGNLIILSSRIAPLNSERISDVIDIIVYYTTQNGRSTYVGRERPFVIAGFVGVEVKRNRQFPSLNPMNYF